MRSHSLALLALGATLLATTSLAFAGGPVSQTNSQPAAGQTLAFPGANVKIHYPDRWAVNHYSNVYELRSSQPPAASVPGGEVDNSLPRISFSYEMKNSHAEAVQRLQQIVYESQVPSTFLTIQGWPALQRTNPVAKPRRGEDETEEKPVMLQHVTTAIAAGKMVFRIDGFATADASATVVKDLSDVGNGVEFSAAGDANASAGEAKSLSNAPPAKPEVKNLATRKPTTDSSKKPITLDALQPGLSINLLTGGGAEPEIAASTDGKNVVVAQQCSFTTSNDGGATFGFPNFFPHCGGGDTSMGFGRSGNFYEATIGGDPSCTKNAGICATAINISTNNGQTFTFQTNAFVCQGTTNCNFGGIPDQEHLTADRYNASGTGGDQVYVAWRNPFGYGMSCSTDSGAHWSAAAFQTVGQTDFPRITAGQDGFVYIVTQNGSNIEMDKYSSCSSGFALQFHSVIATAVNFVTCPVPGLDRCNDGNNLASFTMAVDDTNAHHVYAAYATNTIAGVNENILVQDSLDGGSTWNGARTTQINNGIPGRRYLPWVCSVGGAAYVTWYDRRNSIATANDLTDYFAGSASLNVLGNLVPGKEFQLNSPGTSDPECASGWPCLTRSANDSESCFVQPQFAGTCRHSPNGPGDSNLPCDFAGPDATVCPNAGETCQGGSGCPKYGDYNGNACIAGRLYSVFASATSQPNTTPAAGINMFFQRNLVCCDPQIQLPSPLTLSACDGASTTTTANVCNTGKADLDVNSIKFSDPEFSVATPSSGFPVVISPDSCFPFQVTFTPFSPNSVFATMTVSSNDTVNPSATLPVTGNVSNASIATAIANAGNFGGVCIGSVADLPLTINDVGQCPLSVNNILSSDPEFSTATVMNYPLSVAAGSSLTVQLAFKPTLPTGNKPSNISVFSNDPFNPDQVVPVTGQSQAPLVSVTGNGAFGNVCAGTVEQQTFKVCNLPVAGTCQLNVTNVSLSPGCKDFTIESNPFPEYLGAEVCGNVVVQFTPTSDGTKTCNLIVTSSDPATPIDVIPLSGTTPIPSIAISGDLAFPPTVEGKGVCAVTKLFPVTNTGICPLTITGVGLSAPDAVDYTLHDLASQRNVLPPGGKLSNGGFGVRFNPVELNRNADSDVDITYISDPILGTRTTIDSNLCGEGVFTGARVLVTLGGVPVNSVDEIELINLATSAVVDNVFNAKLQTVTPLIAACAPFQFQREYGTVSDPIHLAPDSYQVKVTLTVAGKKVTKTATFTDNTCGFAHPVVVAF